MDVAQHLLLGLVAAIGGVDVPVPVVAGKLELAAERRDAIDGLDRLVEAPRPALDEAAEDEVHVARVERHAERIEGVGGVDRGAVEHRRDASRRADAERQRRRPVLRLALVPDPLDREIDVVGHFVAQIGEGAVAFERDLEIVERAEVEAVVRADKRAEVGRRRGAADHRRVQRQVLPEDRVAPVRQEARAAAVRAGVGIGRGEARDVARAGRDAFLLHIIAADDDLQRPVVAVAPAQLIILAEAVALLVAADLRAAEEAFLAGLGDDVDHARDRVRSIDGGRAVLQHFDPLDRAFGDRVEVGRAGDAARRRAVHIADAVDQHEHAARAQIAQVDLGRAGADAAAVGRVAQIARIVELGVEAAARARQALEHVVDRVEAGLGHVLLVDEHHRRFLRQRVAADARAGDDDDVVAFGLGGRRRSRLRMRRRIGESRSDDCGQRRMAQAARSRHGFPPVKLGEASPRPVSVHTRWLKARRLEKRRCRPIGALF